MRERLARTQASQIQIIILGPEGIEGAITQTGCDCKPTGVGADRSLVIVMALISSWGRKVGGADLVVLR